MTEDFTVDPARALICWGDLPQPISPGVSNPESGILEITWEAVPNDTDWAMVLAYDGIAFFSGNVCGARRSDGKEVLPCGALHGKEMHVYLGFVSEERDRCSTSVYLGKVILQ